MGWMKSYNFSARYRICGRGSNVHLYDNGYHLTHEDLDNPRIRVRSQINECDNFTITCDHGTPSLGLLAATKNDYGIEGLVRCADSINLYSYGHPIEDALKYAKPGDIYGINVQYCIPDCDTMFPLACVYPSLTDQFYRSGVIVVQAAGNAHLDLDRFYRCMHQRGPSYGFVVSATLRNSDAKRDRGVSDTGIGWFTNYNHDNSVINNWGNRVTTTYAASGDVYFGGRNKGYGSFSGTSSATPLTTGVLGVLQGYMRSRCPKMFLSFDNFVQVFAATGFEQQLSSKMGYMPNIYRALIYIEKTFVARCKDKVHFVNFPLESIVHDYDNLYDAWHVVAANQQNAMVSCHDNNIPFDRYRHGYLNEQQLLEWTAGKPTNLVLCQSKHPAIYLPPLKLKTIRKLRGTTITFIYPKKKTTNMTTIFRVVRTFGNDVWNLGDTAATRLTLRICKPLKFM